MGKHKDKVARLKAKAKENAAIARAKQEKINQKKIDDVIEEDKNDIFGKEINNLGKMYARQLYDEEFPALGDKPIFSANMMYFESERRLEKDSDCMTEGVPEPVEEIKTEEFKTEESGELAHDEISEIPSESEYEVKSFFSSENIISMPNGKLSVDYLKANRLTVLKIGGITPEIIKMFKHGEVLNLYFSQFKFYDNILGFEIK